MKRRHLRSVAGSTRARPPTALDAFARDRGQAPLAALPTLALLQARADADVAGLVAAVVRVMRARDERPALLWLAPSDALDDGVFSVTSAPELFPEALREAAREATIARIAHVGRGALAAALAELTAGLAPAVDRVVLDGRFLAVARAHVSAVVTGDEIGPMLEGAATLRALCEVEVYAPSDAVATALARTLQRRSEP